MTSHAVQTQAIALLSRLPPLHHVLTKPRAFLRPCSAHRPQKVFSHSIIGFRERHIVGSQVPDMATGTCAVAIHDPLDCLQLPCICSYVPENTICHQYQEYSGRIPSRHAHTRIYTRIGVFRCLGTALGTGGWAA